jgi:streptogramin lyase
MKKSTLLLNVVFVRPSLVALAGLLFMVGCLIPTTPVLAQESAHLPRAALFYPPLPNDPRLQYLTTLSEAAAPKAAAKTGMDAFLFGKEEEAPGRLVGKPYGVAIYQGEVFVTDMAGAGYGVFELETGTTRFVRPEGAGRLKKAANITIDTDGTRYITDTIAGQVLAYDRQDRFLRAYGKTNQFKPADVAIVDERLYITDLRNHQVQVLDKSSGELLFSFGEQGGGDGQFVHPNSLALGSGGTIWVVDTNNFRVQQFSLEGEYLNTVGSVGLSPGTFARPKGLAVDRDDILYIVDTATTKIQILDEESTPLMYLGGPGNEPHDLFLPTVIKIDYDNLEYFQKYAHPDFELEYLLLVVNQYGQNSVVVFGYGSFDQ